VESVLKAKITEWIKAKKKIKFRRIVKEARVLAEIKRVKLKASRCWVKKFFKRSRFSKRKVPLLF